MYQQRQAEQSVSQEQLFMESQENELRFIRSWMAVETEEICFWIWSFCIGMDERWMPLAMN